MAFYYCKIYLQNYSDGHHLDEKYYLSLIGDLRNYGKESTLKIKSSSTGRSLRTSLLPTQGAQMLNGRPEFIDLRAKVERGSVVLRFRRDNFYFIGWRVGIAKGQQRSKDRENKWFALDDHSQIDTAQSLHIGGSYTELQRYIGPTIWSIQLGMRQLYTAVNNLREELPPAETARAAFVIIVMISEAARFEAVRRFIARRNESGEGCSLDQRPRLRALVKNWRTPSREVLTKRDDLDHAVQISNVELQDIDMAGKVVQEVSLVLRE